VVFALAIGVLLGGCTIFSSPAPPPIAGPPLAPPGAVGYVVCPTKVSPVQLSTGLAEPPIDLPVTGSPVLGNTAIATAPDGKWAYVVATDGTGDASAARREGTAAGGGAVVIPVDLATQEPGRPVRIPGHGGTRAIVVTANGATIFAASGTEVVPISASTLRVGTPIQLGSHHQIYGMALNPSGTVLYVLAADGVYPIDLSRDVVGAHISTGLTVSSVDGPHGIAVSPDGGTVYVIGQGGANFGGRIQSIDVATGALGPSGNFDAYGIAAPAAIVVGPSGRNLFVLDAANDWITEAPAATLAPAPPYRIPARSGTAASGVQHPTDMVLAPGGKTAYVVDGFDALVPFDITTHAYGAPIGVCSGASSMAIGVTR
jgi:DNA-binding beta-propeller fold protein YncE